MSALDRALNGLRALIADGDLPPGARLPSEDELSTSLGVSRGPLREAIRTLAALGVIETRKGSGSYVGNLDAADLIHGLSLTVGLLPLEGILELTEIRRALESHAASLAAARVDEQALAELHELLTQMEHSSTDDEYTIKDHQFHLKIAQITGNGALMALMEVTRSRSQAYRIELIGAPDVKASSDADHRAIVRALEARDPIAAGAIAAHHVAQTEYWLNTFPVSKVRTEKG